MNLIPVSEELLADSTFTPSLGWWTAWLFVREVTMRTFNEEWCDSEDELLRLENGKRVMWDLPVYDEDEE